MKRVDTATDSLLDNKILLSVAHDLKLPLSAIRSIAIDSTQAPELISSDYSRIINQADSAISIITDLLNVYRLSQAELGLGLNPVSINSELRLAGNDTRQISRLNSKRLKIKYLSKSEPNLAIADQYLVRRVIANLLNNSLRYSNPKTKVIVKAFSKDSKIGLEFTDQGPVIQEDDIKSLGGTIASYPSKRSAGSSGLGLYLVGSMMKLMNGEVSVNSSAKGNVIAISFSGVEQQTLF